MYRTAAGFGPPSRYARREWDAMTDAYRHA